MRQVPHRHGEAAVGADRIRGATMHSSRHRPRVSRETRLLLTTALVAVGVLWALARIRFPDTPNPNPVAPLLSQLSATSSFDDLAAQVSQLRARLEPSLVPLDRDAAATWPPGTRSGERGAALRVRDDLAVALLAVPIAHDETGERGVVAADPGSGLAVVRVPGGTVVPRLAAWSPRRPERPHFIMVTDTSGEYVALRPVFVSALRPIANPFWSDPIWALPQPSDIMAGSFAFTTAGEFVGVAIERDGQQALVPAAVVLAEVERLVGTPMAAPGSVGIDVQALTPELSAATGVTAGVVVSRVDRAPPDRGGIVAGDVIETANGRGVPTPEDWRVRVARLAVGEELTLRVRRGGELREVRLQASAQAPADGPARALGLQLRSRPGAGTEILEVAPGSAGARSGLRTGDVITSIAGTTTPSPVQVRRAFSTVANGAAVLVAVTRGAEHHVTALVR
jgi:hypothetical protein